MILVKQQWGLGNRLFFFAYAMALAERAGTVAVGLHLPEAGDYFEGPRHRALCCWPPETRIPFRPRGRTVNRLQDAGLWLDQWALRIPGARDCVVRLDARKAPPGVEDADWMARFRRPWVSLNGWFDLSRLVLPNAAEVRRFFTPRAAIRREVAAHLASARGGADVLVGIHIRRGDFRNFLGGRHDYSNATYARIMRRVCEVCPGREVAFLVCSDEPVDPAAFPGLRVTAGPGTVVGDLAALAGTDAVFGPCSTFSLWAAFMGKRPYGCIGHEAWLPEALERLPVPDHSFEALDPPHPQH